MLIEQDNQGQGIGGSPICRGCKNSVMNIPDGFAEIRREYYNGRDYGGNWNSAYPCFAARLYASNDSSIPTIYEADGVERCSRYSPTLVQMVRDLGRRIIRVETGEAEKVTLSKPYHEEVVLPDFKGYSIAVSPDVLQSKQQLVLLGRIRIGLSPITKVA